MVQNESGNIASKCFFVVMGCLLDSWEKQRVVIVTTLVWEFVFGLKMNRGLQILLQKNAKIIRPLIKPIITTPVRNSGT